MDTLSGAGRLIMVAICRGLGEWTSPQSGRLDKTDNE